MQTKFFTVIDMCLQLTQMLRSGDFCADDRQMTTDKTDHFTLCVYIYVWGTAWGGGGGGGGEGELLPSAQ